MVLKLLCPFCVGWKKYRNFLGQWFFCYVEPFFQVSFLSLFYIKNFNFLLFVESFVINGNSSVWSFYNIPTDEFPMMAVESQMRSVKLSSFKEENEEVWRNGGDSEKSFDLVGVEWNHLGSVANKILTNRSVPEWKSKIFKYFYKAFNFIRTWVQYGILLKKRKSPTKVKNWTSKISIEDESWMFLS